MLLKVKNLASLEMVLVTPPNPEVIEQFNENRYFPDPGNPEVIVDMRHFLYVGSIPIAPKTVGALVEVGQVLKDKTSAMNVQDFYSNALGEQFFKTYDKGKPLDEQVRSFFDKRLKERASNSQSATSDGLQMKEKESSPAKKSNY